MDSILGRILQQAAKEQRRGFQVKEGSFLDQMIKRAQMDPMAGQMMPPMGAPMGAPMGPPPMGGGMPMDPMAMGGAPPMDPAMMGMPPAGDPNAMGAPPAGGMDPAMLMAMMAQMQGQEQQEAEEGGGAVPEEVATKALDLASAALDMAAAKNVPVEQMATDAAGAMASSGALDNISPEDILALQNEEEMPVEEPPPPMA